MFFKDIFIDTSGVVDDIDDDYDEKQLGEDSKIED